MRRPPNDIFKFHITSEKHGVCHCLGSGPPQKYGKPSDLINDNHTARCLEKSHEPFRPPTDLVHCLKISLCVW
jgi:hypothetical protein